MSIPKDHMEQFALAAVKETMSDASIMGRIEEHLEQLYRVEPSKIESERAIAEAALETTNRKIRNLLQALEDGSGTGKSVRDRLAELEEEKSVIEQHLKKHRADGGVQKVRDVAKLVREFTGSFEADFAQVSLEEQKVMMQKWIEDIRIDREASKAHIKVRRIPAVTPEIAEALKSIENEGLCVSSRSARNRT